MNCILFEHQQHIYRLDPADKRLEHIRGVLRARVGDCLEVGLINGPMGTATVQSLQPLELAVRWRDRPALPADLTLLVGLCRPATVRKAVAAAATLGVRRLIFAAAQRSDPAYARASIWRDGSIRAWLIEAAEQACDSFVPDWQLAPSLPAAIEALDATAKAADPAHRIALDVYEGSCGFVTALPNPGEPVVLAVGPERGWGQADRHSLRAAGFLLTGLGPRVLRVETAITVALALLNQHAGIYGRLLF